MEYVADPLDSKIICQGRRSFSLGSWDICIVLYTRSTHGRDKLNGLAPSTGI